MSNEKEILSLMDEFKHLDCITEYGAKVIDDMLDLYKQQKEINEEHQKLNGELQTKLSAIKNKIDMRITENKNQFDYFFNSQHNDEIAHIYFIKYKTLKDLLEELDI